ncbi:MAG: hypothetical protein ACOCWO_02170 [Candidatus Muiribacteriaceae bacterium]
MNFSDSTIEAAWKKNRGKCSSCGKSLVYLHREKLGERGSWFIYNRSGYGNLGPDTVNNCEILCKLCYQDRLAMRKR